MAVTANIADLRAMAQRRLPRAIFGYLDGGSFEQETLLRNRSALDKVRLKQRVLRDVSQRDTSVNILGRKLKSPLLLAPVGMSGLMYRHGEAVAAKAAEELDLPYILSSMSICSVEEVAAATSKPFWFQLYVWKDKEATRDLLRRAEEAGCTVLVVTVDLQALAPRHADLHNGLVVPLRPTMKNALDLLCRPRWCRDFFTGGVPAFGNIARYAKSDGHPNAVMKWSNSQFDAGLDWKAIEFIRSVWKGPMLIKGILDAEDAEIALSVGAAGVVVSNHGGRQLDGTISGIEALPAIRDRLGDEALVLMDSGIRTGQDVYRALALGADACLIGRAYAYGLAADGGSGVRRAVRIIQRELEVTMALCGVGSLKEINRGSVTIDP